MISLSKRHNRYNSNALVTWLLYYVLLLLLLTFIVVVLVSTTMTTSTSIIFVHSFGPIVVAPVIVQHRYNNNNNKNLIIQKYMLLNNKNNNDMILSATTISSSTSSTTLKNSINNNNNNNYNKYNTTTIWTKEQLLEYALNEGIVLSLTTIGPAYRAIARAKHNTTLIIGYIEGFIRPSSLVPSFFSSNNNIVHLDKMEVFKKIVTQCRAENPNEFTGGGTKLGVGLLLGYYCLLYATIECQIPSTTIVDFLAIDDEEYQHKRLVKYYTMSGFIIIKYVSDDIKSIPDRLLWGGCGTLLRNNIQYLLQFWSYLLEKSLQYKKKSLTSTTRSTGSTTTKIENE